MDALQLETPLLKAMVERRSLRRYRPDLVPSALIETLLTAAVWAPSAHNRQPWRFVVIQTDSVKIALAEAMGARLRDDLGASNVPESIIVADTARSYDRLTSAPVLIVICLTLAEMDHYPDAQRAQSEFLMAVQSTAMAAQNLLLAAHEVGLGACWMCAPLFCPDVVRDVLTLPEDWQPQGVITLGYPDQTREKTRHPLEKSVMWR